MVVATKMETSNRIWELFKRENQRKMRKRWCKEWLLGSLIKISKTGEGKLKRRWVQVFVLKSLRCLYKRHSSWGVKKAEGYWKQKRHRDVRYEPGSHWHIEIFQKPWELFQRIMLEQLDIRQKSMTYTSYLMQNLIQMIHRLICK